jgi:alpha-L-fucosidase 2
MAGIILFLIRKIPGKWRPLLNDCMKKCLIVCLFFCWSTISFAQDSLLKLWYNKPSGNIWEAALPLGNGRLAAMVYGNTDSECIKLNESTVWSGGPNRNDNPHALEVLSEVRKLIFEGKNIQAAKLAAQKIQSERINGMMFQPVGDLHLNFPGHEHFENYYRELNLETATSTTRYTVNGIRFTREYFVSFADQIIVIRLTADRPGSLSFNIGFSSPQRSVIRTYGKDKMELSGTSGDHDGVKGMVNFLAALQIKVVGGSSDTVGDQIEVSHADTATLYLSIATNFINYKNLTANEKKLAADHLAVIKEKNYGRLLNDHIAAYQHYFNRVKLDLGKTVAVKNPTDQRLSEFANGNDPQLAALYFQYGRYLLISSSQPGGQPANLQGIWNDKMNPPWGSKYTININTEMNYWPAEVTNLSEMQDPLVQMVRELAATGRETARVMYGAKGWVAHHNTDLWRITGPVDGIYSAMWPMGGAWLSRHLWEKYIYSGDKKYLESIYPVIRDAAIFYLDFLVEEPVHKWLVVAPSMSPENSPSVLPGVSIAAGVTMDNQILFDLFSHVIRSAGIIGTDEKLVASLRAARNRLPPMQIGKYGQLQEWMQDLDDSTDRHRHVSHLFGLYPANQISPYRTKDLFEAARTSLIFRGDRSTGWSMGWKVNLWARLLDGNHAYKLISDQLTPVGKNESGGGTYPNLFDAHPPFQIDGNLGCTAGVAEMILQSQDGSIFLLPALPDNWPEGTISGLRTRGGFEITRMIWKKGRILSVHIRSNLGGNCRIRSYDALQMKSGALVAAKGNNRNPFFYLEATKDPLISDQAKLHTEHLKTTYLYDFSTKPGNEYELTVMQQH